MTDYFQYVHNLRWGSRFDHLRPKAKDAIVSLLLRQIDDHNTVEKTILQEASPSVLKFISRYVNLKANFANTILSTETSSFVDGVNFNLITCIINLRKINNTQRPNKLFRSVNTLLPLGGLYIGRVETYGDRKSNFFRKYGKVRGELVWIGDFIVNRVIPRLQLVDKLYYWFTKGRLHCMSTAELLGRLVYCGFKIVDSQSIDGVTYFIARKSGLPMKKQQSSYYPIISLPRIGKNGCIMYIYKIRTMHPYSEYIQEYVIRRNGYDETGKPANDFRITRTGRALRRLWIDELPQLIQVLSGKMKLVGLRPISEVRMNDFPEDLRSERIHYKPGCIAPYIALNMPGDRESIEAERIYINDYNRHPFLTDLKYFINGLKNIIFYRIKN